MSVGSAPIADAAVAARGASLSWVGPMADLPGAPEALARDVIDRRDCWATPGLIDAHTHLVFGGQRADEFARRLAGESYEAIARAGGGIASTVRATRAATDDDLVGAAAARLRRAMADGVTTVEVKSGYGLDTQQELRCLAAARQLPAVAGARVTTTFLGAHTVPPEYAGRADDYVDLVCDEMLPAVVAAGLADAVDAFCEPIAFSPAQVARVFEAAGRHELPVKLHADQLSDSGGAALAAQFGALSADHLEYASREGLAAMAAAGTVAVLLPAAQLVLGAPRAPDVDAMRALGVPIAVASDCNPGSAPTRSLGAVLGLACQLCGLTPAEALAGATREAARALGLTDRGELRAGLLADLALWRVDDWAEIAYWVGGAPCAGVVIGGEPVAAARLASP